jgi:hypothetical protein
MPSKRRALTACVLDSRVYAVGGYDGSSWSAPKNTLNPKNTN